MLRNIVFFISFILKAPILYLTTFFMTQITTLHSLNRKKRNNNRNKEIVNEKVGTLLHHK